jgi:hypothetical protein
MNYLDPYLPAQKYGSVEQVLSKGKLLGRLYDVDELRNFQVVPGALLAQFAQATGWAIIGGCLRLGITYPIYFSIVRSSTRNAMAIKFDDWACIVFSDALAFQMLYLVNELSFSRYFVGYREEHAHFQAAFKYPLKPRRASMSQLAASRSTNLAQGYLAKTLTAVGVNFIANHELAHIVNGHLGRGFIGSVLSEDGQAVEPDTLQVYRTLEYDADALGVQLTLHYFLETVGSAGDSTEFLKDEFDLVHTAFAGVYIAMCVMEAVQIVTPEDFHGYTHPPAIFRLFAVSSAAENALTMLRSRGVFSLSQKAVQDAVARVTRAVEWAIADRTQSAPDPDTLIKAFTLQDAHDAELYKCWARIRPRLEKRKLGHHKLAAAQYDLKGRPLRPRN